MPQFCYTARAFREGRAVILEGAMSAVPVYCPKCGLQSSEGIRFCKRCGTNLETVSKVLTGSLAPAAAEDLRTDVEVAYAEEMSSALYNLIGSVATFVVLMVIFRKWWVLFTLFWVAHSIKDFVHLNYIRRTITEPVAAKAALDARRKGHGKKRKKRHGAEPEGVTPYIPAPPHTAIPAPAPTTGELEKPRELDFEHREPPPSVTEGTTRLLKGE